jgi:hypothetical protein
VQTVVELALKCPLKLGMVEVPGMKLEAVRVHWDRWIPELNDDFDRLALGASGEIKQWMFVEFQLDKNTFEAQIWIIGHRTILTGVPTRCARRET